MPAIGRTAVAMLLAMSLMACVTETETEPGPAPVVTGVALPEGYRLDMDRTLIVGEGPRWTGRLSYGINSSPEDMFDFVRRQMPGFGWTEVSVLRGRTSTLAYQHSTTQRAATVQISPRPMWGSYVDFVVAPISDPAMGGSRASAPLGPTVTPAPRDQVTSQPIR